MILTFIFFFSFSLRAQNSNTDLENRVIKVKFVKPISYDYCDKENSLENAVVLEFDVQLSEDKKIFGNKIYAAIICEMFPGEGAFNRKYDYDLKIYEGKLYKWKISLQNKELFEKNIDKKEYWVKDWSREIMVYCGPRIP